MTEYVLIRVATLWGISSAAWVLLGVWLGARLSRPRR
jgi:hypothetical protein